MGSGSSTPAMADTRASYIRENRPVRVLPGAIPAGFLVAGRLLQTMLSSTTTGQWSEAFGRSQPVRG